MSAERLARIAVLAAALIAADSRCGFAQSDFSGRTIRLYIGTGPGGGYDTYGRLVARHIGRHIPGNPAVVAQNMPGASSLTLTNYLFNTAPRDGTAIGIINQAMPTEQYLEIGNTNYDAKRFSWIGRVSSAVEMAIVWHTVPVDTIEDVRRRETLMGGTGPTSSTVFVPYLLDNLAGTRFKVVTGFNGTTGPQGTQVWDPAVGGTYITLLNQVAANPVTGEHAARAVGAVRSSSAAPRRPARSWASMPAPRRSAARSWRRPHCRRRPSRSCGGRSMRCW